MTAYKLPLMYACYVIDFVRVSYCSNVVNNSASGATELCYWDTSGAQVSS
jgi:hypothetical protein